MEFVMNIDGLPENFSVSISRFPSKMSPNDFAQTQQPITPSNSCRLAPLQSLKLLARFHCSFSLPFHYSTSISLSQPTFHDLHNLGQHAQLNHRKPIVIQ
jgi:hypothetical protein